MMVVLAAMIACKNETANEHNSDILGEWVFEKCGLQIMNLERISKIEGAWIPDTGEHSMEDCMDTIKFFPNGKYEELQVMDEGFACYVSTIEGSYSIRNNVLSIQKDKNWTESDTIIALTPQKLVLVEHENAENDIHLRKTFTLRKVHSYSAKNK